MMKSAIAVTLLAAGITPAVAQMKSDAWKFEATPYLFAAGMKGTAGVRGVTADVDMSFSDITKNLDGGAMGMLEARKGPWGFALDAVYMKLSDEPAKSWSGPLGNSNTATLKLGASQYVYQLSAGYRVYDQRTKVDVLGGLRYTRLDASAELDITTGAPLLPDGSRSATRREDWTDAVVGLRVVHPLAEHWTAVGYFDYGIAGGSDKTYQAYAGVNWQFYRNLTAKFGYRQLYQDYTNNDFRWDMTTKGLFLGLGIGF